jgi:8-oxo-dGTP diphosphatase
MPTQVVAAIIERDGLILIGQRKPGQSHALQWEFPGGKVEPGETPEAALARELEEELSILDATGKEIARYSYEYPGKKPIELIFFRVTSYAGDVEDRIYHATAWAPRAKLREYDFLEGDRDFLRDFSADG